MENYEKLKEFCRSLRTQKLWVRAGWEMGSQGTFIIFDGTEEEFNCTLKKELKKKINDEVKRLKLPRCFNFDDLHLDCITDNEAD